MPRSKFPVEVQTPEGEAWSGEVEMISTRTTDGSIGVLANHTPLMAMLDPCELRLYTDGSENISTAQVVRFAQGEGYLQMVNNSALLLVEDADDPSTLDRGKLEAELKDAQEALKNADEGSEDQRRHERDIRRLEAFLECIGGS
jgi:F-type H+-transporting ATPase subunit epsilon